MNKREYSWLNVFFLTVTPLIGLFGTGAYVMLNGVTRWELVPFIFLVFATGLSITGGYHRYFAHRSYKANPVIKFFYLFFGACAIQNSALHWASDHRYHHRYVDTNDDPYNAKEGFFYSHMGWIFFKDPPGRNFNNVRDLQADKMVMWQHRYYVPIAILGGVSGSHPDRSACRPSFGWSSLGRVPADRAGSSHDFSHQFLGSYLRNSAVCNHGYLTRLLVAGVPDERRGLSQFPSQVPG